MKKICFYTIIITLFFGCDSSTKKTKIIDYLNDEASTIIKIKNVGSLNGNINNNPFLQQLETSISYQKLSQKLDVLQYFETEDDIYISLFKDNQDSLQFSIITKLKANLFNIDSLPNHSIETLKYQSKTITKTSVENTVLFSIIKDSVFIGATNKDLLNNTIESPKIHPQLESLINSSNDENQLSVLINKKKDSDVRSLFINPDITTKNLTDYLFFDVDINQNEILLNGVTRSSDSTKNLIDAFRNTIPQENRLAQITPANSDGFLSITFNDFNTFHNNLSTIQKLDSITAYNLLFDNIIEAGVIYQNNDQAIVLNSLDIYLTKDALLNDQDIIDTYRGIDVLSFSNPELFNQVLKPFINYTKANKYCIVDNFIVFSDNMDFLQSIIASYKNQTTYNSRNHYNLLQEKFSDEASILSVVNSNTLEALLNRNLKDSINYKLDNYQTSGIQFIYDSNFAHVNAVIQKGKTRIYENSISESSVIKLKADLLNKPQLVSNHITNEKDIVVQDINNNLYLISNSGKILWKKQLQGAVLGRIEQIDMFKNGRLQLAFATPNRIYVLDRNGKDVSPFPLKFSDAITQPLSVFDYDNNRKYRLLVTQGKEVLMLDAKGKTVKGFNFKQATDNIVHQPQHIRIGRKDYLLFKTSNKLYILDRTGKTRVTPKNNFNYSSEAMYLYNGNFATSTTDGKLVTIDTKGNTASKELSLTNSHDLVTTSKTLVALSENKLRIKQKTYELDYGNYSEPEIFYINDKIYVTVTDIQTQKVYLFDSNAKLLSNFPVYGTSQIDMANIDKDNNLEFVTKGESDTILIYQIN
ncbi:ribonuclease HII [Hanstruepera ponticola]|uniref:ribonuclease HII n=1 Tax=Hanstruepera ponticola TaxID=2042995 RepID=UPI000CF0247D|nr:ribonuclease HII [Hanstruepera ponticola]